MSALTFGGMELARASTGVNSSRFDDNTAVLDELLDMGT